MAAAIPDKVLLQILFEADWDTQLAASSANRALRARLVPSVFKTIVVNRDEERSMNAVISGLLATARELELYDTGLALELIPHAIRLAPLQLVHLTFSPSSDDAIYKETTAIYCLLPFLQAAPYLERLDCVLVLRRQRDLFALLSAVPGLKKLVVQHIKGSQREPLSRDTAPGPTLVELVLGNGVTNAWFELVLPPSCHPPLTVLDVSKGADVPWAAVHACLVAVQTSIQRLHISSSMLLANDDSESPALYIRGELRALRELHVRMLTRRGVRLQEMDGVQKLLRLLSHVALSPVTELHLEFFVMSVFYSEMGRGGGYGGGTNADVTGICCDRLSRSWWQSFALSFPSDCSMVVLIIYDDGDDDDDDDNDETDSENTDFSETEMDQDDDQARPQAHHRRGLFRPSFESNQAPQWKPLARSLLLRLAQHIGIAARVSFASGMYVGAIPGECASSGWPYEWIEEFEGDPEKVMDEKETAIFYNWREWEV